MLATQVMKKMQFVDGEFSPSEAKDIVCKIIDDQSNFFKLQHLSHWIGDCNTEYNSFIDNSKRLNDQKCELTDIINEAKARGCKVRLQGEFKVIIDED